MKKVFCLGLAPLMNWQSAIKRVFCLGLAPLSQRKPPIRKVLCLGLALLLLAGCDSLTAPTPPGMSTRIPGRVVIPGGGLDALGPATTLAPLPARYHAGGVDTLIPSDDYGPIFPFQVKVDSLNNPNGFPRYGICDAAGKIVCDPVFESYRRIETVDGRDFYVFIRAGATQSTDPLRDDDAWDIARTCVITDGQGRFAYDCDWHAYPDLYFTANGAYASARHSFPKGDLLAVRQGEKWGVLDTSGNLVVPHAYDHPLYFSEGLAAVMDNEGTYRYIDMQGKTVLEGLPHATWGEAYFHQYMFSEGVAMCQSPDGSNNRSLFIDKQGNLIANLITDCYVYDMDYFLNDMILLSYNNQSEFSIARRDGSEICRTGQDGVTNILRANDGTFYIYRTNGVQVLAQNFDLTVPGAVMAHEYFPPALVRPPHSTVPAAWFFFEGPTTQAWRLIAQDARVLAEIETTEGRYWYDARAGTLGQYTRSGVRLDFSEGFDLMNRFGDVYWAADYQTGQNLWFKDDGRLLASLVYFPPYPDND